MVVFVNGHSAAEVLAASLALELVIWHNKSSIPLFATYPLHGIAQVG
jgi:hypothetical protein